MTERGEYTHGHHASVLAVHRWRTIANSAAYLEPHLQPGQRLLDVGSGPGTITVEFAERLSPGEVVGIDAAPAAVAAAEQHAAERAADTTATSDSAASVRFLAGDALALPFEDASFDIVHTHQTLQHVEDPVGVLREMARVTRPDGLIAAREVDYSATAWFPLLPGLELWLDVYLRVHRGTSGEPNAARFLPTWAHEAGFRDARFSASVWLFTEAEDRAWWGGAWAQRALESDFARHALDGGHATIEELRTISAAWTEWAAHEQAWLTMTHGEVLARR